jgi:hypothetical protein
MFVEYHDAIQGCDTVKPIHPHVKQNLIDVCKSAYTMYLRQTHRTKNF